jgi:hypothetical protein
MKQGFHVCLYKRKGQPVILAYVQNDEAEICMSVEEFKAEILREIGSVTWTFREKSFSEQFERACCQVIRNIKKSSTIII